MNVILWAIQGLLAAVFLVAGLTKLTQPREKLAAGQMQWTGDFSDGQVKGIGCLELSAAVGLTLPAILDIVPVLVAVAASGLLLLMAGAARTHLRRGEPAQVTVNVVLGLLALFVAVMRFGPWSF